MKILSKFKDYYDYVAGYDTDPRKVYVRTMMSYSEAREKEIKVPTLLGVELKNLIKHSLLEETLYFIGQVWFCDQNVIYLKDVVENKFYFDYNKIPPEILEKVDKLLYKKTKLYKYSTPATLLAYFGLDKRRWKGISHQEEELIQAKNANKICGQPIYFSQYTKERFHEQIMNGRLDDVRFSEHKSPQDTFTELYNWIPFIEPEMPSDPTDMIRFEEKGFDKTISFRNIK